MHLVFLDLGVSVGLLCEWAYFFEKFVCFLDILWNGLEVVGGCKSVVCLC